MNVMWSMNVWFPSCVFTNLTLYNYFQKKMSLMLTRERRRVDHLSPQDQPMAHFCECPMEGLLAMEQSVIRETFYMRHGEEHILVDAAKTTHSNTLSPATVDEQGRVQIEAGEGRLCYKISFTVPNTVLIVSAGTPLVLLLKKKCINFSQFTLKQIQILRLVGASKQTYATYPPPPDPTDRLMELYAQNHPGITLHRVNMDPCDSDS